MVSEPDCVAKQRERYPDLAKFDQWITGKFASQAEKNKALSELFAWAWDEIVTARDELEALQARTSIEDLLSW